MLRKLTVYLGRYKKYAILSVILITIDVVCELLMPLFMSRIVDEGIPENDIGFIARIGGLMVALALVARSRNDQYEIFGGRQPGICSEYPQGTL